MKIRFLFFLAAVICLSACRTGNNFTTRRYTAGHYKPNQASVKKPESLASKHNDKSLKKETHEKVYEVKETPVLIASTNTEKKTEYVKKKQKNLNLASETAKENQKARLKSVMAEYKSLFSKKAKPLKSGKGDSELSTKSLIGFACGIGGVVIDIVCFIAAVAALEYLILLGMLVGLALGILGIIFGTQGIKDYRSSRNTPTLVFGIIGAATGLAAIILAIYLGIYGAALISIYTI